MKNTMEKVDSFASFHKVDESVPLIKKQHDDESSPNILWITVAMVAIGTSLQFGFATGAMNNTEEVIRAYSAARGRPISTLQWSVIVSSFGVGGLLGSLMAGFLATMMGRKTILLAMTPFVLASSSLITFAPNWWSMALGRVCIGIVAGCGTGIVPSYFSEISPTRKRGMIGTLHQLGITVGILTSQTLSTPSLNLLGSESLWQWLFLVPVACSLMQAVVLPFCPESPSYLYKHYGEEAAREALERLNGRDREALIDSYLEGIEAQCDAGADSDKSFGLGDLFGSIDLRRQLIVGVVIQLSMQFSGIDAVFYYSTDVFSSAGVSNPQLATTSLGAINVIITIIAAKYMDSAGRRSLLLCSWVGMCCSFLLLTISFLMIPAATTAITATATTAVGGSSFAHMLSVASMTGVIISFAFGPGCIAWFIIAEIFPMYARDTAMTLGVCLNWVANWLVAFSFPLLKRVMGQYTFFLFTGTTFVFGIFTYMKVPETKNRSIKEVTAEFDKYS